MTTPSSQPDVYSNLPWEALPETLRLLLPLHKADIKRAKAIISLGFLEVKPVLPHLLVWLQDLNWPVAQVLAPYLAGFGKEIVPGVRAVLQGEDEVWIYWVLKKVVAEMLRDAVAELQNELKVLAHRPSTEEVDLVALEILDGMDGEKCGK